LFPAYFMGGQVSDIYPAIRKARLRSFSHMSFKSVIIFTRLPPHPPTAPISPGCPSVVGSDLSSTPCHLIGVVHLKSMFTLQKIISVANPNRR